MKMQMNNVPKFRTDRKGSLHLMAHAQYLGECKHGEYTYYNVSVLFCRFKKEDNSLISRYRVLGISYFNPQRVNEFNRFFMILNNGKGLPRPDNNTNLDFNYVGQWIENAINNYEHNVYVQWQSQGKYSTIKDIAVRTGYPLIRRTPEMVFPDSFYQKYGQCSKIK